MDRWSRAFNTSVRRWLAGIGCRYCARCHSVKDEKMFSPRGRECKRCNADRSLAYYYSTNGVERARDYRANHPETHRRACERYRLRKRGLL